MLGCMYLHHNWQAYVDVQYAQNSVFLTAVEH